MTGPGTGPGTGPRPVRSTGSRPVPGTGRRPRRGLGPRRGRRRLAGWAGLALALTALLPAAAQPAAQSGRPWGDVRVLAHVPPPGYPALSLVAPDRTVFVGTFAGPACCTGPSKVFRYDLAGQLLGTWTVRGQDPAANNGVQVATRDRQGRLYLLDQHPARVVVLDPATGAQRDYATFTDVPSCPPGGGTGCSDTLVDNPPEPDYAAWGPDGSLYVTDFTQALIWRVPPGGGAAQVWFTDPRLDGLQFGPAGIALSADGRGFLLSVTAGRPGSNGVPASGGLYRLGLGPGGSPGPLQEIWASGPGQGPDGFAVARSGHVYLALVGPGVNAVVELGPDGRQLGMFPAGPVANAAQQVPFDEPSSVAFDGDDVIVTNDAYLDGDQAHMVLFDVYVAEPGLPLFIPPGAGG